MPETPYVETEALLAVMNGDEDEARRILGGMYRGERVDLLGHAERLAELAEEINRAEALRT